MKSFSLFIIDFCKILTVFDIILRGFYNYMDNLALIRLLVSEITL